MNSALRLVCRAFILCVLAILFVMALSGVVRAEEPSSAPLEAGQPAPFSGVLVSEARLDQLTERLVLLEECKGTLEASEAVRASLTADLAEASRPAARTDHSEWPWVAIGFIAGAAAAGLAVWGAVEVLRAP